VEQRNLAEEVAGVLGRDRRAALGDLDLTVGDCEELATAVALADHRRAGRQFDEVAVAGDQLEVVRRQLREERNRLQLVSLRIVSEQVHTIGNDRGPGEIPLLERYFW
jgi:hypothetical protein